MLLTTLWALAFATAAAVISFTLNRAFVQTSMRGWRHGSSYAASMLVSFAPMLLFLKVYQRLGIPEAHVAVVLIILVMVTMSGTVYGLISGAKASGNDRNDDDKRS